MDNKTLISIIIPIHNGSKWINQCFDSILKQNLTENLDVEVCVFNDASTDDTDQILNKWKSVFKNNHIELKICTNFTGTAKGVGYAKNKAVSISTGTYICFQDIDDILLPDRIKIQYMNAVELPNNTIIGSQFRRAPANSTERFTQWANSLSNQQLHTQIYTSNGPTVIMPTWFCHRYIFNSVGGFSEAGKGTPEDLIFFYQHLDLGGRVFRVDQCLVIYTYHQDATTFSIHESTIWDIRLQRLEKKVLCKWNQFTIWNAGKQGRRFYNSLSTENRQKVVAFCDIDAKKIGKNYISYNPKSRKTDKAVDIVHFKDAHPPFIICIKINLTKGEFEHNLKTLQLTENVDYILFS